MWKCPVCGSESREMRCVFCGFDDSLNYCKYPTLAAIPCAEKCNPTKESESDPPRESPKHTKKRSEPPEEKSAEPHKVQKAEPPRKKSILLPTLAVILLLAIILGLVLRFGQPSEESEANLPTLRTMASDCSRVLRDDGYSGAVLELQVQNQELNEKFGVLTVTCAAEVLEDGQQKEYVVELVYEYGDGIWNCKSFSKVKE